MHHAKYPIGSTLKEATLTDSLSVSDQEAFGGRWKLTFTHPIVLFLEASSSSVCPHPSSSHSLLDWAEDSRAASGMRSQITSLQVASWAFQPRPMKHSTAHFAHLQHRKQLYSSTLEKTLFSIYVRIVRDIIKFKILCKKAHALHNHPQLQESHLGSTSPRAELKKAASRWHLEEPIHLPPSRALNRYTNNSWQWES